MAFDEDMIVFLLFSWTEYLWEHYLGYRQKKVYQTNNTIPEELRESVDEEKFEKARLYGVDKIQFKSLKKFYNIAITSLVLYNRWMIVFWHKSKSIAAYFGIQPESQIIICNIFIMIIILLSFVTDLPFTVYSTFVIEQKHGFNKQTVGFFVKDQLKSLSLSFIITVAINSAAVYITSIGGSMFKVWLWLFTTVAMLLILALYPTVIAPWFDKFVPLSDGSQRKGIEDLVSRLKFPLSQVYIVEGSKRSTHSNAYFSGVFGAKRIVLFDTLIEKYDAEKKVTIGCTENEILGVLAHELGHWHLNHIYKNLLISEVILFLLFSSFDYIFKYRMLYSALGFPADQEPIIVGSMVALQIILAPCNSILLFFMNSLSRKFELQADDFAVSLNYANELKSALIKLSKDNLDYPIYDKLFAACYNSHPTVLRRIENIEKHVAKNNYFRFDNVLKSYENSTRFF